MKKVLFFTVFCVILSILYLSAQNSVPSTGIEISFGFNRQSGFSSNQFVIWIEDSKGNFIKTLYATKFTASGGWQKRPLSIPLWVQQSGLSAMNKAEIDAFSGATPRSGVLSYRWDGTDKNGRPLPPGQYRVCLEATLRNDNRVVCSAVFPLTAGGSGNPVQAEVRTQYFGSSTGERNMIEDFKVFYRP